MTHELLDDYMADMLAAPAADAAKPAPSTPALSLVSGAEATAEAAAEAAAQTGAEAASAAGGEAEPTALGDAPADQPAAAPPATSIDLVADLMAEFDAEVARAAAPAIVPAAPATPPASPTFDLASELLAEFDAEVGGAATPAAPAAAAAPAAGGDLVADLLAEFDAEVGLAPSPPPAAPAPAPAASPPPPAVPVSAAAERAERDEQRREPGRRRRAEDVIKRWLRFTLADQSYAVEVLKVQEVMRVPDVLPLRGADPSVLGVMNLRGQIVPVVDMGQRLLAPAVDVTPLSRVIVLEQDGEAMGILVSTVAEVMAISEASIEHPSSLQCGSACESLTGVCRQNGHLTILLDAGKLLA
ncbi:MAG TPA: chemotaxis protein CheW [Arenimonas sp.]|nr:chemotaxis protein CheW [Arenimonas sp.]